MGWSSHGGDDLAEVSPGFTLSGNPRSEMSVHYRFVTDDDYDHDAVVDIVHSIKPSSYLTAADLRESDDRRRRAGRPSGRWTAVLGNDIVGYAWFGQNPWLEPGRIHIEVMVRPAHRGRGYGRSLLGRVERSAVGHGASSLIASVAEADQRGDRFARRAGFTEIDRWWRSQLDLTRFDPADWRRAIDAVTVRGIRLTTVARLRDTRQGWERELHRLYTEIELDVPEALPIKEMAFDDFVAKCLGRDLLAEGFLVALDGDAMVGLTEPQAVDADPLAISQDLTGVRASHRRRGIALALKAAVAAWAKEQGYASIRTYNAQSNTPMLRLNERLGFVRDHGAVEYAKEL